ncbi:MAG: winged helix-turn-helix domain-containing protein [Reichenbachiella sp.]
MNDSDIDSELISRIVTSKAIGNSSVYRELLLYLVECTRKNEIPNEAMVRGRLFQANTAKDFDNAKVRVYISNLRKKLDKYFKEEGVEEKHAISIPKGAYKIVVGRNKEWSNNLYVNFKSKTFWVIVICMASVGLNLYLYRTEEPKIASMESLSKSKIWRAFLEDDRPVLLVIGDLLIYTEKNMKTGKVQTIRNPYVNSPDEFEEYISEISDSTSQLKMHTYTYLIKNSVDWIKNLTEIFYANNKPFQIKVISRMDAKDLHDHNVIFVGMQKTAGLFNNYFIESNLNFAPTDTLIYNSNPTSYYTPSGDPDKLHTDYGFVAKYPGPNGNTIFMFGGLFDTGTSQSLKNFTNQNSLILIEEEMKNKFGDIPDHFEILFKVNGVDRVEMDTEIVLLNAR